MKRILECFGFDRVAVNWEAVLLNVGFSVAVMVTVRVFVIEWFALGALYPRVDEFTSTELARMDLWEGAHVVALNAAMVWLATAISTVVFLCTWCVRWDYARYGEESISASVFGPL